MIITIRKRATRQWIRAGGRRISGGSVMIAAASRFFCTRCPHCRSVDFRSVGVRNGLERALGWLLQPHRCSLCGRHVLLFRWQAAALGAA